VECLGLTKISDSVFELPVRDQLEAFFVLMITNDREFQSCANSKVELIQEILRVEKVEPVKENM